MELVHPRTQLPDHFHILSVRNPVKPDLRSRARKLGGAEKAKIQNGTYMFMERSFAFPLLRKQNGATRANLGVDVARQAARLCCNRSLDRFQDFDHFGTLLRPWRNFEN